MNPVSIIVVLLLSVILCMREIPQIQKDGNRKELWVFSLLLFLGISLVVLRSFNVSISNPSDWLTWIFSPLAGLLRKLLE